MFICRAQVSKMSLYEETGISRSKCRSSSNSTLSIHFNQSSSDRSAFHPPTLNISFTVKLEPIRQQFGKNMKKKQEKVNSVAFD